MKRSKSGFCAGISAILCVVAVAMSGSAEATPVSVQLAFNSFTGVVGSDGQLVTYLDQGSGPEILCPNAGCGTGIGVKSMQLAGSNQVEFWNSSFGVDAAHNAIQFVSSGVQNVSLGQEFLLGTISYTNGIWFTDPEFSVTFTSSSTDRRFNNQSWHDTIHLGITPNLSSNTPAQNADFIYLTALPKLGSVRAFELGGSPSGNTVTAALLGEINSLDLTRFANASGGGFLDPGIGLQPIPEPGTFALVATALAGLGWLKRRRSDAIR
jgi:hypothetical protein